MDWIESLRANERLRLFDRLIRADVALASTLTDYARTPRVARLCFLLMNECALARAVHVGELVLLFPTIEAEAPRALEGLARRANGAAHPIDSADPCPATC